MNVDMYCDFLNQIGHRVITSTSGSWFNAGPAFYEHTPPVALINPLNDEMTRLFQQHRLIGVKYCTADTLGKPSFLYVCDDKGYDLHHVQPRMRTTIRQGLRQCYVCPIDFTYLQEHGMRLNRDTLARQRRRDRTFHDPVQWQRFCHAARSVTGALAWGAFVAGQLAAYMMAFVIDGYSYVLHQMSRTDLLKTHANHALTFVATKEMLALPDIQCVSHGHESVRDLPGLDAYKTKLGYRKQSLRQVVRLHPTLKPFLLGPAGQLTLQTLRRSWPHNDLLIRASGIVHMAQYCYPNEQAHSGTHRHA